LMDLYLEIPKVVWPIGGSGFGQTGILPCK
jgi:hypothetical protein